MGKLTPQNHATLWTRGPPETPVAHPQPPPLSRLLTDPTTVGARGTVPSVPRLIDLPQFRLRRRAAHPPPPQGCPPAPDPKPGPSTKPPMRAFRLQLTGRPSSATGDVAKKRVIRCENKTQRPLNAPSDHQKVDQRTDQKVIVTNPRVRRYHSTEILMDLNKDRTRDVHQAVETNDVQRKRRSLPFRPFLWRRGGKPGDEPPGRIDKRTALQFKPRRRSATRKRISLPPVFKLNPCSDEASERDQVVKVNPQAMSTSHLPKTNENSSSGLCFRYVQIHRQNENMPFGIFVKKGKYGFVVTRVPEKCPLRLGDEIVEINGCKCPDMSLSWLVGHLQSSTSIHAQVIAATTTDHLGRE
ncbi:hypothetical protein AAHC03_0365 [Spirometra sp. Aus1]